jgi:hypothetical protein
MSGSSVSGRRFLTIRFRVAADVSLVVLAAIALDALLERRRGTRAPTRSLSACRSSAGTS